MARHIAQRLMISLPVLLGVLMIGFLLLQVVPTDPATVVAGPSATKAEVEAIRQQMGLDRPLWVQFAGYLGRVLQLDLGRSMISNRPVVDEIALTFWPTVELMLACLIWAVPLGISLGTLAARRRTRGRPAIGAETAQQHVDDAAVHALAHDVGENGAGSTDQRSGHDQQQVADLQHGAHHAHA